MAVSSQNAFLDLYHPFYSSLIPLRTDSLFIRTQEPGTGILERMIRYRYSDDETVAPDWQEIREAENGLKIWRIDQQTSAQGALRVVETQMLDSITGLRTRERALLLEKNPGQIDTAWYEAWDTDGWRPVQMTVLGYTPDQLLQNRSELRWDKPAGDWVAEFRYTVGYDNQKRVTWRQYDIPKDSAWTVQNRYDYTYRSGEDQPAWALWRSNLDGGALTPVDSTAFWYDSQGWEDSSIVYLWNAGAGYWITARRQVLTDDEQKKAQHGAGFTPGWSAGGWQQSDETVLTPGEQVFTDEASEEVLRVQDPATGEWIDKKRKTISYEYTDSTHVRGVIQISEPDAGTGIWSETFFAEAWFTIGQEKPGLDSAENRSNQFSFAYSCGLPNPYIRNVTLTFPESDAQGEYELKIVNEEGRLVYRRQYGDSGGGFVDAALQPGFYLVSVSRGGVPLCTQKLIVQQ